MKQIPPLGREAVPAQFVETRAAPDVGCDAEVVLQELRGGDDFAQDGAAPEKLDARRVFLSPPSRNRYMPRRIPSSAPFGIAGCG